MTMRVRNVFFACLGLGAAVAATPSCTDNNVSLFVKGIEQMLAPTCVATADSSVTLLSGGLIDLAFGTSYQAAVVVGNQLVARADQATFRSEPNRVNIEGADISLRDSVGNELKSYSVTANGVIDPGLGGGATYGAVFVELIPASVMRGPEMGKLLKAGALTTRVQVAFKVFGHTLGGRSVTSDQFVYQISTCYGCSITIPPDAADKTLAPRNNCRSTTAVEAATPVTSCFAGEDPTVGTGVSCLSCVGSRIACNPCSSDADCTNATDDPTSPGYGFPAGVTCGVSGVCVDFTPG